MLKDIEAPYYSNPIEFDVLFKIVCNFYKKFLGIFNLAYLAESHENLNQLTRHCRANVYFRHSPNRDVFDIKRAKRLNKSAGPCYTWRRE
jgi:hypothetical protein